MLNSSWSVGSGENNLWTGSKISDRTAGHRHNGSDHIYRFPHRTFQEYLAGLHFLNDNNYPQRLIEETAGDPLRWRETVLLAAGSAQRPHMIWTMVQELCPDPPPANAAAVRPNADWQAFLAAQVLIDTDQIAAANQGSIARKTRPRVQQWQRAIVERGALSPRDRAMTGEALAALGDDRPGVLGCDEMRLCYVPASPFWLGDEAEETQGHWNDSLDKPYWLAQYPVTVAQYREFVRDRDYEPSWGQRALQDPDNWPVAWINWYDALAFCDWLHERWQRQGRLPAGYRVTLPSEAEWEKAARGGRLIPIKPRATTAQSLQPILDKPPETGPNEHGGQDLSRRHYPWGDEPEQEEVAPGQVLYRANNESAGIGGRCAVGSFPAGASPVGCLDMSGQVWEWTRSYWGKRYPYRPTPEYETINPRNQEGMVLRGGAYYQDQNGCSVRDRNNLHNNINDNNGVRVCVSTLLNRACPGRNCAAGTPSAPRREMAGSCPGRARGCSPRPGE